MSRQNQPPTCQTSTVVVWDMAQRVAHWVLVGSFATAWLLSEGERWRQWHVVAGLVALGVALWRLGWGWLGSRHARFADFVRGPTAVARYLRNSKAAVIYEGTSQLHTLIQADYLLGYREDKPLRFVDYVKPGLLKRLFGGK